MRSMTGYGKGTVIENGKVLTIELKTVNNRYLEINSRVPKSYAFCEEALRENIPQFIKRGSVEVFFNLEDKSETKKGLTPDMALAKEYVLAAKKLRDEFLLEDDFHVTALLTSPNVLKLEASADDTTLLEKLTRQCTIQALTELNKMREAEGATIEADLIKMMGNVVSALEKVSLRAPKVVEAYRTKIKLRIQEILQEVEVDESRLCNEVAFFADKCDINEEISRLSSHINQFLQCLNAHEPQGRKLDFLSQEMNREMNTMGSKSNDVELTNTVIYLKNELEKIKEQIRNVE